ncbi:ThiF family adenylyltransferase [Opacimonas viscosa]|uniref:ThiF family adenylyltransferase n=1 Tax=Opacimonas viscosa TaxID=2961944 RepID=A0AA41X2V1_9ALTE|nr:ThiF family adenylyltransferase [Opacimonas viscosa]MCP3428511.1 ThiF family adenylyltransferase [Opacimonas viscosa]
MSQTFKYKKAFSRNIGWITEDEQQLIRSKRIAIAGMGGVGGEHLITLSRLGFQDFHIADFDTFDVHNFNRQAGAFMSTVDKPKAAVMAEQVQDINPKASVKNFDEGVFAHNVEAFLDDVDIYVDSLDFFAIEARELVFQKCTDKGIPIVTAAPLGMGAALLTFMPGQMTFDEYFNFSSCATENEKLIKFLVGLSPSLLQRDYLVLPEKADFVAQKGPSLAVAVKMCAGLAESTVLKIVLGRGKVISAPRGLHFDAYKNKAVQTWCPFGNKGLIQRLKYQIAKKIVLPA